jgi:hypothetical protein
MGMDNLADTATIRIPTNWLCRSAEPVLSVYGDSRNRQGSDREDFS